MPGGGGGDDTPLTPGAQQPPATEDVLRNAMNVGFFDNIGRHYQQMRDAADMSAHAIDNNWPPTPPPAPSPPPLMSVPDVGYVPPPRTECAAPAQSTDTAAAAAAVPEPTLPGCPLCFDDVAVPPVVLNECGHLVCGECLLMLEDPRKKRAAGFSCPLCRATVKSYVVPVQARTAALEHASVSDAKRAFDAHFMATHMRAPPAVTTSSRDAATDAVVETMRAVREHYQTIWQRIPRTLVPMWTHSGDCFQYRIENAFVAPNTDRAAAAAAPTNAQKSLYSKVRNRLATNLADKGIVVRRASRDIVLSLPVERAEQFATARWVM